MQLKFRGNYAKLLKCVVRTRLDGKWRKLKNGQKQFRSEDGGYLNWWEKTGTITFQGSNLEAGEELSQAFIAVASRRKRLFGEYNGRVFRGQIRLQSLYPE